MNVTKVSCQFFCEGQVSNRKTLFKEALMQAKAGKVLYILQEELNELPPLSQDFKVLNKHYLKLISFLYVSNLESLIETLSTLPEWQNAPCTIILDGLNEYCDKNEEHNACGLVALLKDTMYSCSKHLKTNCKLFISINKDVAGGNYCNVMQELYSVDQ